MNYNNIPYELRSLPQWCLWSYVEREGKFSKVPFQTDGKMALANTPATWSSFAAVEYVQREKGFEGIGFMFSKDDEYIGIDIDKCIDESGNLSDFANEIIERLDSYTEFSPSGKGVHIIVKGQLPSYIKGTGKKSVKYGLEIYQNGRYFTMTGDAENENGIYDRTDELEEILQEFFTKEELEGNADLIIGESTNDEDDGVTWERMFKSKSGSEIKAMFDGELIVDNDHSSTDLALANHLAFWCDKDYWKMDRMFRQSNLYRDKWDEMRGDKTYGEMTLLNAISTTSSVVSDHEPQHKPSSFKVIIREGEEKQYNFTELGNAEWFSDAYAEKALYSNQYSWLLWNGKKWESDDLGKVERWAAKLFKELWKAEDNEAALKWARSCESRRILTNSLALAKSFLPVRTEELDRHKYLFNVQNGILDLKSGTLLPHSSKYLLTKISSVGYEKDAECPTWEKFLASIFKDEKGNADYELIRYVQKLIGYSMTGDISDQSIYFLYGSGKNGKSTFINVIHDILGEYARQSNKDTFIANDNKNGANNDVARLVGSRFVSAIESAENEKLDESLVKQLTGGEKVTARFLHKEFFEFTPEFKVFFTTNHRPIIRGTDEGIWRRVKLIPFTVQIAEADRDRDLPVKLRQEVSGILNWMLEGCLLWQKEGLTPPQSVEDASNDYKREMDILHPFLNECCIVEKSSYIELKKLYDSYLTYTLSNREIELKKRPFTRLLESRGFEKYVGAGNKTFIRGLTLTEHQQRINLKREMKY